MNIASTINARNVCAVCYKICTIAAAINSIHYTVNSISNRISGGF